MGDYRARPDDDQVPSADWQDGYATGREDERADAAAELKRVRTDHEGAVEAMREKLNEMTLHDETDDPHDEGYMEAVLEMWAALDSLGGGS
jgi:hypothetical protein